jgi:phospholipase/carboxylesterase
MAGEACGPAAGGRPDSLVLLLHGVGADGADLIGLAGPLGEALPRAAFWAPDAPEPCDFAPWGRQWFPLGERDPHTLREGARRAGPWLAAEAARVAAELGVARVALLGFSQGAMVALQAGLRMDPPPAAIVAIAGRALDAEGITARPPVLLLHGAADPTVPAEATRAAVRALEAAGVPVRAAIEPGLGHGISEAQVAEAADFLARALA